MPSVYAHYRLGVALLPTFPADARRTIQRFRRLFDVGLHGPDIFFYYATEVVAARKNIGSLMHTTKTDVFLKNMILSSSGENIYPEDIEFVLNQHPLVNESLVVEEDGNLVALVQLDGEKLKKDGTLLEKLLAASSSVSDAVHDLTEDILYKQESLISEIKFFVNEKVNKMSKISKIKFIENLFNTAKKNLELMKSSLDTYKYYTKKSSKPKRNKRRPDYYD